MLYRYVYIHRYAYIYCDKLYEGKELRDLTETGLAGNGLAKEMTLRLRPQAKA